MQQAGQTSDLTSDFETCSRRLKAGLGERGTQVAQANNICHKGGLCQYRCQGFDITACAVGVCAKHQYVCHWSVCAMQYVCQNASVQVCATQFVCRYASLQVCGVPACV